MSVCVCVRAFVRACTIELVRPGICGFKVRSPVRRRPAGESIAPRTRVVCLIAIGERNKDRPIVRCKRNAHFPKCVVPGQSYLLARAPDCSPTCAHFINYRAHAQLIDNIMYYAH